jgi:hypothetical protein
MGHDDMGYFLLNAIWVYRFSPDSATGSGVSSSVRRVSSAFALGSVRRRILVGTSEAEEEELRDLMDLNLGLVESQFDGLGSADVKVGSEVEADECFKDRGEAAPLSVSEDSDERTVRAASLDDVVEPSEADGTDGQVNTADDDVHVDAASIKDPADTTVEQERSDSHNSFHLTQMHISQQLRSMSQLSGPSDDSDRLTPEAWTFHRRERSGCFDPGSNRSRHMNHNSEFGMDSLQVPASWGQVTQDPDASSSIYSRPASAEAPEPYEIPADLTVVADWPLKTETEPCSSPELPDQQETAEAITAPLTAEDDTHITIVEPDLPSVAINGVAQEVLDAADFDSAIIPNRPASYKSNSSSATKHSRFLERFTPPKKLVRKRRSIFKFLRAGSRRNQTRSISTPVICSPHLRPLVDGPSDDNELLTVQYELTTQEANPVRSVSLNNLATTAAGESLSPEVASSPDLHRKPSLAEYERHLSVIGDDRRRPSIRDLKRLSQIEEDDKHEHIPAKKSFSYYSAVQDTDPLMQAALERQLREKALFRSPSKHSVPVTASSSMSFLATSWDEPSSAQPQSPDRDPLDSEGKKTSTAHLSPPRTPIDGRSRTSSFSNQKKTGSKKPMILHTPSSVSQGSIRSRIGSSLDSWSRYPSHTRRTRCESAGTSDNVRTIDFALNIRHERIRGTDESDPFRPGKRVMTETSSTSASARVSKKSPLPKSRSATFGSFVRYYSNLLTSPDFHGKGRRTSVAMGGKLAHPELEMLSPVLPEGTSPRSAGDVLELEDLRKGDSTPTKTQTGDKDKSVTPSSHRLDAHVSPALGSPAFRGDSVFTAHSPKLSTEHQVPAEATAEPEESTNYLSASHSNSPSSTTNVSSDRAPDLDGTLDTTTSTISAANAEIQNQNPSKALAYSASYQSCLLTPPTPSGSNNINIDNFTSEDLMPPPTLKPIKPRSPASAPSLNPNAAIRRFPSVTVVDDRKGHWRSVSFISVKSGKSVSGGSFVRESSNDLLRLMEGREREERERLLGLGLGLSAV